MISTVTNNFTRPIYTAKSENINFNGKKQAMKAVSKIHVTDSSAERLSAKAFILNSFVDITKFLFHRQFIFDTETGRLQKILSGGISNGQLLVKKIKGYDYKTGKLSSIDEYENRKLIKSSSFYPDGKTLKWTCEYGTEKDTIHEFYPDGRTLKAIQTDCGDKSARTEYDEYSGRLTRIEHRKNDMLVDARIIEKNRETNEKYINGIISESETIYETGEIEKVNIQYDEKGNPLKGLWTYKDKSMHKDVEWKDDTVISKKYINNDQLHYTKIKNRTTGKEQTIYHSKVAKK